MPATVTMTKPALEAAVASLFARLDTPTDVAGASELPKTVADALWQLLGGRSGG